MCVKKPASLLIYTCKKLLRQVFQSRYLLLGWQVLIHRSCCQQAANELFTLTCDCVWSGWFCDQSKLASFCWLCDWSRLAIFFALLGHVHNYTITVVHDLYSFQAIFWLWFTYELYKFMFIHYSYTPQLCALERGYKCVLCLRSKIFGFKSYVLLWSWYSVGRNQKSFLLNWCEIRAVWDW